MNKLRPTRTKGIRRGVAAKADTQLLILSILRLQPGTSRTQIAKQTHLGKATVSAIVRELIQAGLVREEGAGIQVASAGRRPVQLRLDATSHLAIGFELTGRECISALT